MSCNVCDSMQESEFFFSKADDLISIFKPILDFLICCKTSSNVEILWSENFALRHEPKSNIRNLSDFTEAELAKLDPITISKMRSAEKTLRRKLEDKRKCRKSGSLVTDPVYLANIHRLDRLTSGVLLLAIDRDKSVEGNKATSLFIKRCKFI